MAKSPQRSYLFPDWDGTCVTCGRDDQEARFGSGKAGECSYCAKVRWNVDNPVKVRAQRLYGNAQKRALKMGWPAPDFSSTWIEEKILSGFCEVTGIPFDLSSQATATVHAKNPWVPSLDRTDSAGVYAMENVKVVVFMYNVCKAEFNHSDVVRFCRVVAQRGAENG